jgi:hypothetical protein
LAALVVMERLIQLLVHLFIMLVAVLAGQMLQVEMQTQAVV